MADIMTIPQTKAEQDEQVQPLLDRLFTHLKELSSKAAKTGDPHRIYFSGEYDNNQTDFERASNYLEMGVIANNKITGVILLHLLRIIIDRPRDLDGFLWPTMDTIEEAEEWPTDLPKDGKKMSFKWLVDESLSQSETAYLSSFDLNETFTIKLYGWSGEQVIQKHLGEVDAWTLTRIENALYDRY